VAAGKRQGSETGSGGVSGSGRRSTRVTTLACLSLLPVLAGTLLALPGSPAKAQAPAAERGLEPRPVERAAAPRTSRPGRAGTDARRPNWGAVTGWIADAGTRQPVSGARVFLEVDGQFAEKGPAAAGTDAQGRFQARAPLGKISTRFDWGRLLMMHPISILLSPRSVTKQTRIVDAQQMNVRVEAPGYQPFVGRVGATVVDAGKFSLTLDDILLAPAGASLASFTPGRTRREVIEKLAVEPAVAAPGEKVRIVLAAHLPEDRGHKYRAFATSTAIRLIENQIELKREKRPAGAEGPTVFSREVTLPKSTVEAWTEIGFFLVRDDTMMIRRRDTRALLQVVRNDEERIAAERVTAAFQRSQDGEKDGAARDLAGIVERHPQYRLAYLLYGDLALQLNRPHEAGTAYEKLVELAPQDYGLARSRYAFSLLEVGKPDLALAALDGAEKSLSGRQRIPPHVALGRARVFAEYGNFAESDKWLAQAGTEMQIPDEILNQINLRRMKLAVEKNPENAELRMSYARVLDGARQREEALQQLRKAVELQPGEPWAYLDLGSLLHELGRRAEALEHLRHALRLAPDNPEALLALAGVLRDERRYAEALPLYEQVVQNQKLNLHARHQYALMLYATGALEPAREELREVVDQARDKGDLRQSGLPLPGAGIFFGPKRRLVAGFSVPEAAADAVILETLDELAHHPSNALTWQNLANALIDVDLPDLALEALERSRQLEPNLLETRFLEGVAHRELEESAEARAAFEAVLSSNPLHPRARLELAQLHAEEGRLEAAQAELLAHARHYPQ
jgi:tetratricopeptide (TPR) repeat protein